jgi:hypothetical protein
MVRFSDMLGGSGEPDDGRAAASPYAALANEELDAEGDAFFDAEEESDEDADVNVDADHVPMATFDSPEAVLDRLTQYASSARAAEQVAPPAEEPTVEEPVPEEPVGDDLLPRGRGIIRKPGRMRKRHP